MKLVDEYRNPVAVQRLLAEIRERTTRRHVIMEVCGGQTHSLLRYGIDRELHDIVELIHGPGCPVCVTPAEDIDTAVALSRSNGITITSFGDMLRVPGTRESLNDARVNGAHVRVVYSPIDAVTYAERNRDREVVFLAVGFETTAPATALAVLQARERKLTNFSLLVSHVRVQPAMEAIMQTPGQRVKGFLAAGHVCTITGYDSYHDFAIRHRVPVVVTGFEPIDLLQGIRDCVDQLERGVATVTNQYARSVRSAGNTHAQAIVDRVYQISDTPWRGFGLIPDGGFQLRPEFREFDARERFPLFKADSGSCDASHGPLLSSLPILEECRSALVLSGQIRPGECPHFGSACTPDRPLGAPMVSSEGTCHAYFRYHVTEDETTPMPDQSPTGQKIYQS